MSDARIGPGLVPIEGGSEELYLGIRALCSSYSPSALGAYLSDAGRVIAVCGLSSVAEGPEQETMRRAIQDSPMGPFVRGVEVHWITRGAACAWAAADRADSLIIKAGTVAFAHAFHYDEHGDLVDEWRCGGWGSMSGRDGGAYSVGLAVLELLFAELDGRRPRSLLGNVMQQLLPTPDGNRIDTSSALARWVRDRAVDGAIRSEVAQLMRVVSRLASDESDTACQRIIERAAEAVCESSLAAFKRVKALNPAFGVEGIDILLHGGVLQNSRLFVDILISRLRALDPASLPINAVSPIPLAPVMGCLRYALSNVIRYSSEKTESVLLDVIGEDRPFSRSAFDPSILKALSS